MTSPTCVQLSMAIPICQLPDVHATTRPSPSAVIIVCAMIAPLATTLLSPRTMTAPVSACSCTFALHAPITLVWLPPPLATSSSGLRATELYFRNKTYDFKIGGFGIGGIGGSSIRAVGEVYDLRNVRDFPGVYGEARAGYALGRQSAGHLWLQNPNDVVLHLRAARERLMLSVGADGVAVSMD